MKTPRTVTIPCPRCRSKQTELVRDMESGEIVFTDGKCIISCKTCDRTEIVVLRRSWLGKLSAWPHQHTESAPDRWNGFRMLSWLGMLVIPILALAIAPEPWKFRVYACSLGSWWIFVGAAAIWKQTTDHWASTTMGGFKEYGRTDTHFHGNTAVEGGIGWIITGLFIIILSILGPWLRDTPF